MHKMLKMYCSNLKFLSETKGIVCKMVTGLKLVTYICLDGNCRVSYGDIPPDCEWALQSSYRSVLVGHF